jgi:hypothetical protein
MYDYKFEGPTLYLLTDAGMERFHITASSVRDITDTLEDRGIVDGELIDLLKDRKKIRNRLLGVSGLAREVCGGMVAKNPVTGKEGSIENIIIHLNDHEKWSREQIADWLDTLPNQPVFELDLGV